MSLIWKKGRRAAERALLILMAAVMLTALVMQAREEPFAGEDGVCSLSRGWVIEGSGEAIELPALVERPGEGRLILRYEGDIEALAGKTISTRAARENFAVMLSDRLLYRYEDARFPRNEQMKSKYDCDVQLPVDLRKGDALRLCYSCPGVFRIPEVFVGTGSAVLMMHLSRSALTFGIVFVMAVLAVIAIGVALYLRKTEMRDPRFADVAVFLLLCGLWCLTDTPLIQQSSGRPALTCVVSFDAFMLMSVPMLCFVRHTGNLRSSAALRVCIALFCINAAVQSLLALLGIRRFIDMLFVTHILLVAGVLVCGWLLIREYRRSPLREFGTILGAFGMLGACGLLALLLYWALRIPYYGFIYEVGILIFVVMMLCGIITTMAANIRFRTEMTVFQRMASEDKLTGMANRRAFDERMEEIRLQAPHYEDAALVFFGLNGLKRINDAYGHNMGDELIIALARCVEDVFDGIGTCYRTSGDEFCAVVVNPKQKEEAWLERLDDLIGRYNAGSRCPLSVARGVGYLRGAEGELKTISDWKYETDRKLDEDRKRQGYGR